MDYQFARVLQLLVLSVFLNFANAIIARDLLLTPKQGLQVNGKSVYYAEEKPEILRNTTSIPWARTLKHVTFVTIFTNAAVEAVAGNLSKLREYNSFLESPYIRQNQSHQYGRFGDIILLANGRLEQDKLRNGSYRFVEGRCLYECEEEQVIALWQVQKIRHRDAHRTYRYEMKYSVSPLQMPDLAGNLVTNSQRDRDQIYIQKDDDYPQNFGRLTYEGEQKFADRRADKVFERNFRQVPASSLKDFERKANQLSQSTYFSDRFLPTAPSKHMPNPDDLNIGEYIKGYTGTKATSKIENYSHSPSRMGYHTATTYRPTYNLKHIKPENYLQPQAMLVRFPDKDQEAYSSKISTPLVTHHFHHHFFMPPSSSENSLVAAEQQQLRAPTVTYYKQQTAGITPPPPTSTAQIPQQQQQQQQQQQTYVNAFYEQKEIHMPPAPQKVTLPIPSIEEQQPELLKQHLVQVTPVPPLPKPHVLQMFPITIGPKIPLYIYPATVEERHEEHKSQHIRNKPFRQSEPMPNIRYSEPDPLYVNVPDEESSPQLETPPNQQDTAKYQRANLAAQIEAYDSHSPAPEAVAAQLPSPAKRHKEDVSYSDDDYADNTDNDDASDNIENQTHNDQEQHHSFKAINIATEKTSASTVKTEATITSEPNNFTLPPKKLQTTTIEAERSLPCNNPTSPSSRDADKLNETVTKISLPQTNLFVSTSTTKRPLHMVARAPAHRTTTEQPVLKWKPRRKANSTLRAKKQLPTTTQASDKHEQQSQQSEKDDLSASDKGTKNANEILNEIYEVLTQKSVSKSVSIKIGSNGEEIPILEDDLENRIKRKNYN